MESMANFNRYTLYRRCRRGCVQGAQQVGRTWLLAPSALKQSLRGTARELVELLARDEIGIGRSGRPGAHPLPLTAYRWMSVTGGSSVSRG